MTALNKLDQPAKYWDRLFTPSSCLAVITTVDREGRMNAASFSTCMRVKHEPVYIAFTTTGGRDTANNVLSTGEFTANLPRWDRSSLEKVRVCGLPFASGVNELKQAAFTPIPSTMVQPPPIFKCTLAFRMQSGMA